MNYGTNTAPNSNQLIAHVFVCFEISYVLRIEYTSIKRKNFMLIMALTTATDCNNIALHTTKMAVEATVCTFVMCFGDNTILRRTKFVKLALRLQKSNLYYTPELRQSV